MMWQHLSWVRAWSAAGLLTGSIIGSAAMAEPAEPAPDASAGVETVGVLAAQQAGDLTLKLRGQGQDKVRFSVRNNSAKRLNVVLPPGLVAASVTGQLQSMGLGSVNNAPGGFGSFRSAPPESGLRSVPPADPRADAVPVPAGQTVEFNVPAVCLNYGMPTPTPRDSFNLVDVDDYSPDPRVRKALKTLATLGTSHGTAQATMWRVCNNVPFPMMTTQFAKVVNTHEIALASRFIEALDASGSGDLVDPSYLTEARVFVHVRAEGPLYRDAKRLDGELDGLRILGMPVRVVGENETPTTSAPALHLNITLTGSREGETKGRVSVRHATSGGWLPLGQATFSEGTAAADLHGSELARTVDHAVAAAFVTAKPFRRSAGSTTMKIENRLPFTLSSVVVKAGTSAGAPTVPLKALGIGPARTGLAPLQAATGTVESVELNGL
jgi:hypothetical protein